MANKEVNITRLINYLGLVTGMMLLSACSGKAAEIKPGGMWITPADRAVVTGIIHFAAYAYPTNPGDPKIDHVYFTTSWEGRSGSWIICKDDQPDPKNPTLFECDFDSTKQPEVVPEGELNISFDVYDAKGNANYAPNGTRTIDWHK